MFDTAIIDDFNRTESPLVDGGDWVQMYEFGAGDYTQCSVLPVIGGSTNNFDFIGNFGPGYAIRQSNPGAAYDQECYFKTNGHYGPGINSSRVILRADLSLNFYEFVFTEAGSGCHCDINRWVSGAPTTLASGDQFLTSGTDDCYVGATADGNTITGYAMDLTTAGGWIQIATTTDSTYPFGFVGFGTRGINILPVAGGGQTTIRDSQIYRYVTP